MKNVVLDLMFGLIVVACIISFIGIILVPDAINKWDEMRRG